MRAAPARVRSTAARCLVTGLLAALFGACVVPASEVLVVLDTNAPADRATTVSVTLGTAAYPEAMRREWTRDHNATAGIEFPASFAIVPSPTAPPGTPITLQVELHVAPSAIGEPDVRFARRARFSITSHRTTFVRLFLPVECATEATGCGAGVSPCTVAAACESRGLTCGDDGTCVDPNVTPDSGDDGGTPDVVCPQGTHRCGSICSSDTSVASCGSLCAPCPVPRGATAATCDGATCGFTCGPGFHLCGSACATDQSTATCGSSCQPCPAFANATTTCDGVRCGFTCSLGFADCDGIASNGCEADLTRDPMNCGACGTRCATYTNTTPQCAASRCSAACNQGFTDCDGMLGNGCERSNGGLCSPCGASCPPGTSSSPPTCPAACTGGCTGDLCLVDCSTIGGCDGQTVTCPPGMRCTVNCAASIACRGLQVVCPPHAACLVDCRGSRACESTLVQCPADAPCTTDCNGANACDGALVDCGTGACEARCAAPIVPVVRCNNSCSCASCAAC